MTDEQQPPENMKVRKVLKDVFVKVLLNGEVVELQATEVHEGMGFKGGDRYSFGDGYAAYTFMETPDQDDYMYRAVPVI